MTAAKLIGNIDFSRTSTAPMVQFTGTSITNNPADGYQPYSAWIAMQQFNGITVEQRTFGRPACTLPTMMCDLVGAPPSDDVHNVDNYWNWQAPANIQVVEGGTNDCVADLNLSAATVCRRLETYCRMRKALGLAVVLVGPLSRTGSNNIQSHDAVRAALQAYHTATVNGAPRWHQYANRYVDFTGTAIGDNGCYSNTAEFIDGIHLRGDVNYPHGRALMASYVQTQVQSLITELSAGAPYVLNLNAFVS